jgi:hypothetical protein
MRLEEAFLIGSTLAMPSWRSSCQKEASEVPPPPSRSVNQCQRSASCWCERRTLDEATRALGPAPAAAIAWRLRLSRGLRWGAGNLTLRRGTEPTIKNPTDDAANERCHPE